jgi:ABC-2 type transport system permease protein
VAVALPADIMDVWAAGGKPDITIYYAASASPELSQAVTALIAELSYAQTGQQLRFETSSEVLGPDLLGAQLALRDRMRPMMAILILLLDTMSLASLITVEIEQDTARALLVTPMRSSDLFTAKAIIGVCLAFIQAALFMGIVGGFNSQPLVVLVTL